MFYVTAREYVGPDCGRKQNALRIRISLYPAAIIGEHHVTDGIIGEFDGWCIEAHGAYQTMDAARQAVAARFCALREVEAAGPSLAEYHGRARKRPRAA